MNLKHSRAILVSANSPKKLKLRDKTQKENKTEIMFITKKKNI